jgi:hypothetical protein
MQWSVAVLLLKHASQAANSCVTLQAGPTDSSWSHGRQLYASDCAGMQPNENKGKPMPLKNVHAGELSHKHTRTKAQRIS